MNITIATYFANPSEKTKHQLRTLFPYIFDKDPFILIKSLFASAKILYPECQRVFLTDIDTKIPSDFEADIVERYPLDIDHLTLSRSEAQSRFLTNYKGSNFLLFLDYDILLQNRLDELAEYSFDLAVTTRKHKMPINGGVLIFHPHSFAKGAQFMHELLGEIKKLPPYFHLWYGSQIALKEKIQFQDVNKPTLIQQNSYQILLLPSEIYNFSSSSIEMKEDYSEKKILHFKGARKQYQLAYFKAHLSK